MPNTKLPASWSIASDDLTLVSRPDGHYTLGVVGQNIDLSPSGFAGLCRLVCAYKHQIDPDTDTGAPYVVAVSIPYNDVDSNQTTTHYTTCVVADTLEGAELLITAVSVELDVMGLKSRDVEIRRDNFPEDRFFPEQLKPQADIGLEMAAFRHAIAIDSDLYPRDEWWEAFGMTEDDKYTSPAITRFLHSVYARNYANA